MGYTSVFGIVLVLIKWRGSQHEAATDLVQETLQ